MSNNNCSGLAVHVATSNNDFLNLELSRVISSHAMSYLKNRHPCLSISLSQTIATFGNLDILVSNAAVNPTFGPTLQVLAMLPSVCVNPLNEHTILMMFTTDILIVCVFAICRLQSQPGTRYSHHWLRHVIVINIFEYIHVIH